MIRIQGIQPADPWATEKIYANLSLPYPPPSLPPAPFSLSSSLSSFFPLPFTSHLLFIPSSIFPLPPLLFSVALFSLSSSPFLLYLPFTLFSYLSTTFLSSLFLFIFSSFLFPISLLPLPQFPFLRVTFSPLPILYLLSAHSTFVLCGIKQ